VVLPTVVYLSSAVEMFINKVYLEELLETFIFLNIGR
jgi:hypothetical protein